MARPCRDIVCTLPILGVCLTAVPAVAADSTGGSNEIRIVGLQGTAQVRSAGAATWVLTTTNQVLRPLDRLRTGPNSRVTLRWSDQSIVPFNALTEVEILEPHAPGALRGLHLIKGILSFFHRDQPGRIRVITRGAVAGVEGTEFVVAVEDVADTERTTLSVIDGQVRFGNDQGVVVLTNGQQAVAGVGQAPLLTPGFIVNNVLQWCFYYPGVLDLVDLPLTTAERTALGESLAAYRAGDLLAALALYPAGRTPASDAERVYHAALLLSVGQVEQTEAALAELGAGRGSALPRRSADALRQVIATVKRLPVVSTHAPQFATELLAASYYEQGRAVGEASLQAALDLARQATAVSPRFSFAWVRVAELEFSFGHLGATEDALERGLALAPRNAQALALRGFVFAARNQTRRAIDSFNQAMAVDSALGNAWLGRGLVRIRRGDSRGGREDLLVAAAREPQRAFLRSYLGKAYADVGDEERARHELSLAKRLDPSDPTAWLYSALLLQQENRINEAVRELETSQELNENRRVYRSQFLLDQDRAVRSANLAGIYQDAGMFDLSVREAGRAVSADYANWSAHLFLANSYDQLRDPNRINLRYETPAENEYLIANLLAPVGAGLLAQSVSQQEYSKLFERDRLGVASTTEYLSRGAWTEHGAQFGNFRNSSYLFEGLYRTDPGQRPNNDFEERELRLHLKQQLTARDTVYLRAIQYNAEGGDVRQYYDQRSAILGLRSSEKQEPLLHAGYHHEWNPGVHTLLLAGRLVDRLTVTNPSQLSLFIIKEDGVTPSYVQPITAQLDYRSAPEIYTAELQQIWQRPSQETILGVRFQVGEFETHSLQTDPVALDNIGFFPTNGYIALDDLSLQFERLSVYAYQHWQPHDALRLIGGLSYDHLKFPENRRIPPLSSQEDSVDRVSPKAGLVWTPGRDTAVRFAYTRSLAGASLEQSTTIEPTQVAGFNQAFRGIIPESVSGAATDAARFETYGLSLEQRFPTRTYLGVLGEILGSEDDRTVGYFEYTGATDFTVPAGTRERLEYVERSLVFTVNQLLANDWAMGARYRVTAAELDNRFEEIPSTAFIDERVASFQPRQHLEALLHQVSLHSSYHHRSGFFAQFEALWHHQSNHGYQPSLPGDDFWQLNLFAGYRFPRRRAEIRVGLLNLTDQDYRLNPLTLYDELPRERTFAARLQLRF